MDKINRRRILGIGALFLAGVTGVSYALTAGTGQASYEHIFLTVDQMKDTGGLIVDIRTPPEWAETGVIDGAELVTFTDPASFLARIGPQIADGRDLILVCRSGNRTEAAAKMLEGKIPNRIVSIDGGMRRVISTGYQTVPPS